MTPILPFAVAIAWLVPAVAKACPYASGSASSCGSCGSSLFSYGTWLLLGVGVGLASVAFQRRGLRGPTDS
ncbi:MAG: hypothetical protein M3O46_20300 [Myxococcota bacterium]|nr:hypothetical protein [Myxococcota bacterium]